MSIETGSPGPQANAGPDSRQWTARARKAGCGFPPERSCPTDNRVYGFLDLRIRDPDAGQSRLGDPHGLRPGHHGPTWCTCPRRPLRELTPPLERRGLFLLHGDTPVGQVLHGGVEGKPTADVDHRSCHLRDLVGAAFTAICPSRTSTPNGSPRKPRMASTPRGAGHLQRLELRQMLMWHIVLLPLVVVALTGVHVLMVRRRGIVPPFAAESDAPSASPGSSPQGSRMSRERNEGRAQAAPLQSRS